MTKVMKNKLLHADGNLSPVFHVGFFREMGPGRRERVTGVMHQTDKFELFLLCVGSLLTVGLLPTCFPSPGLP